MYEFLKAMIPTQMQVEWGVGTGMLGSVVSYVIGFDGTVQALLCFMVIDYISGMMAATINPALSLNSQKGFRGICKKVLILCIVSMAHILDGAMGVALTQAVVTWFFIGNEGLSILENAAKAGLPVPNTLKNTLEQLKQEKQVKR